MKHQMWMNDKIDQQLQTSSRIEYSKGMTRFPILSWYLVSAVVTVVVLFV